MTAVWTSISTTRNALSLHRRIAAVMEKAGAAVLFALTLSLTLASSASARQATPLATPTAIDPGPCSIEPRSNDQMRELIEAGLPRIVAFMAGTPEPGREDAATPTMSPGVPADAATVAAVTETALQFAACSNAVDTPAIAAVLTKEGAGSYLSFRFLPFRAIATGATGTPTAEIDPDLLNTFLATLQLSTPLPQDLEVTLYGIESVTELEDGRVRAIILLATGGEEPRRSSMLLRDEDGRYRIIFGRETGDEAASTPAA